MKPIPAATVARFLAALIITAILLIVVLFLTPRSKG
jgi:hypothetical protein